MRLFGNYNNQAQIAKEAAKAAKAALTTDEIDALIISICIKIHHSPLEIRQLHKHLDVIPGKHCIRASKIVDLFFSHRYLCDYVMFPRKYQILSDAPGSTLGFNFENANKLVKASGNKVVEDLRIAESAQLFFLRRLKSPECVRESQEIRKKLDILRGKALRWMRESRRNQSNDGRSLFEQVDELIEYCHALLSAEGKVQAAADLINVNGRDIHRATLMNVKRRVEKILKLDTPEKVDQFWKYVELQGD
jgi:hypothetical protein